MDELNLLDPGFLADPRMIPKPEGFSSGAKVQICAFLAGGCGQVDSPGPAR
jgi:hypothetical protein